MPMRAKFLSLCTWLLVACGTFLAACGALDYWDSRSAQTQIAEEWQQDQPELPPAIRDTPQSSATPRPREIHTANANRRPDQGTAVAKLLIPRLDTVLYVLEGTDYRDLKRGPGHVTGSVLPGEDGNCIIAGHRDTHFRVLKNIQEGDEIILERGGRQFHYRVNGMTIVRPDNTASLRPTSQAVLNLITCYPFRYVGSAPKRFIVHADLEGSGSG